MSFFSILLNINLKLIFYSVFIAIIFIFDLITQYGLTQNNNILQDVEFSLVM